jgi:isocitrate dehydrogenase
MFSETRNPIVPFMNGDGVGQKTLSTARAVLDAAAKATYGEKRQIRWMDLSASDIIPAIRQFHIALVGPVDLDPELYRALDIYARVWPVRYFEGLPSPMKDPARLNVVIFGEATKDSIQDPQRLVRMAIRYALANDCNIVTLVSNDPDFAKSGHRVAREEFGVLTATEVQIWQNHRGTIPPGKMMINDRSAESVFQQLLLRPEEHKILVAPVPVCNYLATQCAAQAGIAGFAPVAALGDGFGIFEAAGDPASGILSGIMMLDYLHWNEAADLLSAAFAGTIAGKMAPRTLASRIEYATELKTTEFGAAVRDLIGAMAKSAT